METIRFWINQLNHIIQLLCETQFTHVVYYYSDSTSSHVEKALQEIWTERAVKKCTAENRWSDTDSTQDNRQQKNTRKQPMSHDK